MSKEKATVAHSLRGMISGVTERLRVFIAEGTAAVFGDMGGRGTVVGGKAGEEGILAAAGLDAGRTAHVGSFVPDAGDGVIAGFPFEPDDEGDRAVGAFDVDRGAVETGAGDEKGRAEGTVGLLAEDDGLAEGTFGDDRDVVVGGGAALVPIVADVVDGVEGEITGAVGGEASIGGSLDEIPKGGKAGGTGDGRLRGLGRDG